MIMVEMLVVAIDTSLEAVVLDERVLKVFVVLGIDEALLLIVDVEEEIIIASGEVVKAKLELEAKLLVIAVDEVLYNIVLVMLVTLKSEVDVTVEGDGVT